MAETTSQAVSLAEAYGVCPSCPYIELVDKEAEMTASQLDNQLADNTELLHTPCTAIKTGRCKLAEYAIEQQVNQVQAEA